jgi:hypothetical protein
MSKISILLFLCFLISGCAQQSSTFSERYNKITSYKFTSQTVASTKKDGTFLTTKGEFFEGGDTADAAIKNSISACENWIKARPEKLYCHNAGISTQRAEKESERKERIRKLEVNQEKQKKENIISNIKKTCLDFGYKENTDKYADCLKDLYIKESSEPIVIKDSGSEVLAKELKRQRRMDASDDLDRISKDLLGGKSIGESVGGVSPRSSSGDVCFFDSESRSGLNKICYYKCVSGIKTKNVGASQMCPTNY